MVNSSIEVCFSPSLIHLFEPKDKIVVVIDVLRATSSICTAFTHGANIIIPVASIEESRSFKDRGYLLAGERNGIMIDGFDMGNSPFSFMGDAVKGRNIAITTTNGTQAIHAAKDAKKIVIGSFLNLDILSEWLMNQDTDLLCLCSGWKNKFNLEDTLLAGAIVNKLRAGSNIKIDCDSAIASEHLFRQAKYNLFGFLENSSHRKRLKRLNIEKDIEYCLTPNICPVIPVLQDGGLLNIQLPIVS